MTRLLMEDVASGCDDRILVLLEGGYDPKRLGEGTVDVVRALAGLPPA
jgi:acetoin utilization deacetylase AcuC-like enzyme